MQEAKQKSQIKVEQTAKATDKKIAEQKVKEKKAKEAKTKEAKVKAIAKEKKSKEGAVKEKAGKERTKKQKKQEMLAKAKEREQKFVEKNKKRPFVRRHRVSSECDGLMDYFMPDVLTMNWEQNCLTWGDPHWVTFDGRRYDWYGTGEFVLYKDPIWHEQVNTEQKKPRRGFPVSYNSGVGFKARWHRMSVQFTNPTSTPNMNLYLDGHKVNWKKGGQLKAGALVVYMKWQPGAHARTQVLVVKNVDSGTYVTINVNRHGIMYYMDVRVHVQGFFKTSQTTGNDSGCTVALRSHYGFFSPCWCVLIHRFMWSF